jgi:peptidoglycan/LPS O-acetylase OafA/YrhL
MLRESPDDNAIFSAARRRNTAMSLRSGGSADSHAIRYRADIDGLRAVAVLSVVFFHLSREGLRGGYLGVDMFFVLSGYLITAIIWREMQEGQFSIVRFYDRRIRRIMPALLLLLFVATPGALILLLPSDLVGYSRSLLATLIFSANIYFWRDADYFSQAAEQKPLLHIWSLGVEEQFYMAFPIVLLWVARWWPRHTLSAIATLAIGSLAANIFAAFVGGSVPAFFLLPTRAWELEVGAVLALLPAHIAPRAATAGLMASIGALSLAAGMIHPLDSYWYVPAAVPAVLGTALLILAGQHHRPLVNRMLELRPVVFVGLISYSLYLWHWPIIVFGQYYLVRDFTLPEMAAALGSMTACAIGTWRFVERPFRSKNMPIGRVRIAAGLGVLCLATAAAALLVARGLPIRLSAEASIINQAVDSNYRCPLPNYLAFGRSRACVMNLPSRNPTDADVILLGNSHAQMYEPVWASILAERGRTGLLVPVNGCLPTVQANVNRECIEIANGNLSEIANLARARTVILGMNWWHGANDLVDSDGRTIDNTNGRAFMGAVDNLIDRLHHDGKQVVLIGPIAEPGWNIASILSRQLAFGHPVNRPSFLRTSDFERRFGSLIRHFEARGDVDFARPDKVQCPADRCYYVLDGHALFSDGNHIATAELPRFRTVFEAALPQ